MKNPVAVISVVLVYLLISSCAKNDEKALSLIEQKLPGKWNIESVTILSLGSGINYQGETFYHDTILYDIGSLEIPIFSTDLLDLNSFADSAYKCKLIIEGDTFNIRIEHLFMSGSDYFVYFRHGYSDLFGTENQNAAFLNTSRLLNFNAYLFIINDNQIRIKRASGNADYTVMLSK
jgi:hypothetical protein